MMLTMQKALHCRARARSRARRSSTPITSADIVVRKPPKPAQP
ncbi:MAG: hypothetical protein R2734_07790 [Nocardioides sp.]